MEWFGLAFLLLLGFAEGQNGGIDPQCDIIEEEELLLKRPLIAQLKKFDADKKFQDTWRKVFYDDCYYQYMVCELYLSGEEKDTYGTEFRKRVRPFQLKAEIFNATRNVERIILTHDVKLRRYQKRKYEILNRYYGEKYDSVLVLKPIEMFSKISVNNYDSLADASRCKPCTDPDVFASCLYNESNKIKEVLTIFQEVAVSKRPVLMTETIGLLVKEFTKFPKITNEQIFDFFRNTFLIREYNRYISDVESYYGEYLHNSNKKFANNFTQTVQTVLEPAYMKNTCVGNVLKDVITQIKPFVTPDASTTKTVLPKWDFDRIVSSYVKPTTETDIDLIVRFDEGFSRYRDAVFERYDDYRPNDHHVSMMMQLYYNTYAEQITSIIDKGTEDLKQCPDFGLVYGNSDFKDFVDKFSEPYYEDHVTYW